MQDDEIRLFMWYLDAFCRGHDDAFAENWWNLTSQPQRHEIIALLLQFEMVWCVLARDDDSAIQHALAQKPATAQNLLLDFRVLTMPRLPATLRKLVMLAYTRSEGFTIVNLERMARGVFAKPEDPAVNQQVVEPWYFD